MFKFNIKVNNEHSFKTVVNNTFEFICKVTQATTFKKLFIHDKQKGDLTIGRSKLKLNRYNHKLLGLPSTLRQFVGSYVYIKAKMRFTNNSKITTSNIVYKIIMKSKMYEMYINTLKLKSTIRAKMRFKNNTQGNVSFTERLYSKLRFTISYIYKNSDIIHRLILKTKPTIGTITSTAARGRIKCKARISTTHGYIKRVAILVKAKMKLNNLYESMSSLKVIIGMRCKINSESREDGMVSIAPLVCYKDVDLINLPPTLKEFAGNYTRLLCKVRFQGVNNARVIASRSLCKCKARLLNLYSNANIADGNLVQSKPLTAYTSVKINELPKSLKDFSFNKI